MKLSVILTFFTTALSQCVVYTTAFPGGIMQSSDHFPPCGTSVVVTAKADSDWYVNAILSNESGILFEDYNPEITSKSVTILVTKDVHVSGFFTAVPGILCFPGVHAYGPGVAHFYLMDGTQVEDDFVTLKCGTPLKFIAQADEGSFIRESSINEQNLCDGKTYCEETIILQDSPYATILFETLPKTNSFHRYQHLKLL